ncbi:ATP-binding cassette domain-containing protein [Nocardiopsis sp. HUAS JQ3]|uniref:ATP-binding cassette domain-containing protein n=1 Tax=Nocardiopsis sp. HUAS JQ3 TaxID=3061629 RepID=UPI0023A99457|nr:ATP-binding cassette domain-containing protein [Nocardiopsis sp. HUAS JQ3]WDZ91019.1 ATP-binding cassette domain-containing protein [Nocardiopsis sp. HUAS JQ3]
MIEVDRLSKRYGAVSAVDDLSFTVPDGAITGFLGPNGAGKSTTMRCVLGLHRPTTGAVLVDGFPLTSRSRPADVVGAVLDASWFHPGRTGLAHLRVVAASAGLPGHRAAEALDTVGMTPAGHRAIGGYSLGMKQRLGLATALLGRPRNIILDEPMNGLDPQGMEWMRTFLCQTAASGHAVLISSHLLTEMETLADRLLILGRGRLIGQWEAADLLNARSRETLVRTDDDARLEQRLRRMRVPVTALPGGLAVTFDDAVPDALALSRACRDLGLLITALEEKPIRLEETFLDLTGDSSEYRADRRTP